MADLVDDQGCTFGEPLVQPDRIHAEAALAVTHELAIPPTTLRTTGRRHVPHRVGLVYLRRQDTPAQIAAGFGIAVSTAQARPRPASGTDTLSVAAFEHISSSRIRSASIQ
ncbi:hypothetical protein [Streptomyces sp. NPDC001816]|uniref:hypothetical protein n=1 Tax=Streptomyces sp. NPDC001816 TaxID=3364612 RepID=UPI0036C3A530